MWIPAIHNDGAASLLEHPVVASSAASVRSRNDILVFPADRPHHSLAGRGNRKITKPKFSEEKSPLKELIFRFSPS